MKQLSPKEIELIEVGVSEVRAYAREPAFTPLQQDILTRLEAYPHEWFDLTSTHTNGDPNCLVCVAGALGDFDIKTGVIRDAAGRYGTRARNMMNLLIGTDYGRSVPHVQDYPADRVPKQVAISAVRSIFAMRV